MQDFEAQRAHSNHFGTMSNKRDEEDRSGCCHSLRLQSSLDDITTLFFWKACVAECLGTFILVITALGSTIQGWVPTDPLDVVQIALSFGLCVATSVWIIGHISGGHINPAVTMGMLVTRRISLVRAILYIIAQIIGAIIGASILKAVTPEQLQGSLGCTGLGRGMTAAMGCVVEFFITMFLVLTVFASCDSKRTDLGGSFPLTIGLSVTMGHLWAVSKFPCRSERIKSTSFSQRVVNVWNSLPPNVINAQNVNSFKCELNKFWYNKQVKFLPDFYGSEAEIKFLTYEDGSERQKPRR